MTKKFLIPKLNKESWQAVQESLDSIGRIISDLYESELDASKRKELELVSIHLGMLDVYFGRHYTINELSEEFKKVSGGNTKDEKN